MSEDTPELPPFNPSAPLWCAQLSSSMDPAIDQEAENAPTLLAQYATSRHPVELARVPLRAGEKLTLWKLRPLTSAERAELLSMASPSAVLESFRIACVARMDNAVVAEGGSVSGTEVPAELERGRAKHSWVKAQMEIGGGALVDELGALALQRANVHPKARRPYVLR